MLRSAVAIDQQCKGKIMVSISGGVDVDGCGLEFNPLFPSQNVISLDVDSMQNPE